MKKCPYCFEPIEESAGRCLQCLEFIIDPVIDADYKSIDKKKCVFCGKSILKEARVCRHCHKRIDEVDEGANDYDKME